MYKVTKFFTDLHDGDRSYDVGDIFPRKGIAVTEERIAELAGSENRQGVPLIEEVIETEQEENVAENTPPVDNKPEPAKRTRKTPIK